MIILHQLIFDKDVIQGLTKFKWINPERGSRESPLFDLYAGMTCSETGVRDQIRSPGRYSDACFGTKRLDGG